MADLEQIDKHLITVFRECDYEASMQQNRYRLFQISYIMLAMMATLVGSLQALMLSNNPYWLPILSFIETVIALIATFLATMAAREPPFQLWMVNRQQAEGLRRECFRYIARLPPYDQLDGYKLHMAFSERAANLYRGVFPAETDEIQ